MVEPRDTSGPNDAGATLSGVLHTPALRRLLDVRQGINMSVEVFDRNLQPQLPPLPGSAATRVRLLITNGGLARWRPMVEECLRTVTVQSYEGQAVLAVATPLVAGDAVWGVVLVASTRDVGADAAAVLRQMAEWFAELITARLTPRPAAPSAGVRQLSSLYRLLSEAVPTSTDRAIVYRFAEALAVWVDVEIRGYVADVGGHYSLAVSLPGSDPGAAPAGFESRPLTDGTTIRHLSTNECRELGFRGNDVVLAAVAGQSTGGGSVEAEWVLAASPAGAIDLDVQLPSYVDALAHALNDLYAVESSRLTWALMQHFIQLHSPEDAARAAVADISAYVQTPAYFTTFGSRGLALFAGDHAALLASSQTAEVVSVPVAAPAGYTAVVGMRRSEGRVFSHRDLRCLRTAASAFAAWLPSALPKLVNHGDRRRLSRSFDQVVERESAQAAAQQDDISLLVIAAREGAFGSEATQRLIGRIRQRLRPADLAGRLTSGEIGVLLPQTPRPGAFVVAKRLYELLSEDEISASMPHSTINVASRSLDSLIYGPLS